MVLFISTKSQILELDLIIAVILFIAAAFLFYTYSSNLTDLQDDKTDLLLENAEIISNHLVSAGYPSNWTEDPGNAIYIGITDGNKRVDSDKLIHAAEVLNYQQLKWRFGVSSDFYVFFEYKNNPLTIDTIHGFGKPGINETNINQIEDPKDLIKIQRLLFYDSKIINMGVYVW